MWSLFKATSPVAMMAGSGGSGGKKTGAAPAYDIEAERRKKAKSSLLDTPSTQSISEKSTLV